MRIVGERLRVFSAHFLNPPMKSEGYFCKWKLLELQKCPSRKPGPTSTVSKSLTTIQELTKTEGRSSGLTGGRSERPCGRRSLE